VKVMKQGGLTRTRRMIECAAAAGLGVVVGHGFGLTLSTLAEAAVAATSEAVLPGCEAVGPLKMAGDVVGHALRLDDGVICLTDTPGLGASVDAERLARYRVAEAPRGRAVGA
jgi:L-alanine-DL-glutamate epimerase-like enolase superfamily enzyme